MKKYFIMTIILILFIAGIPEAFALFGENSHAEPQNFTLTLTESGEVLTLTAEEYLIGCLFAQTDISYELEALKAQACAAHTYALKLLSGGNDLSDSASSCQPYFTAERAKEYYGGSYEKYLPKIREAAAFGAKHAVYHDGKPIYSVYCSLSAGMTARPEYIWEQDLSYLSIVTCPADTSSPLFEKSCELSLETVRTELLKLDGSIILSNDPADWFTEVNKDEHGYVLTVKVGEKTFIGGDIWRALGLRSTSFDISWNGMAFSVKTKGCGHGAGMSQYQANSFAKEGMSAEEILGYFYCGCEVAEV